MNCFPIEGSVGKLKASSCLQLFINWEITAKPLLNKPWTLGLGYFVDWHIKVFWGVQSPLPQLSVGQDELEMMWGDHHTSLLSSASAEGFWAWLRTTEIAQHLREPFLLLWGCVTHWPWMQRVPALFTATGCVLITPKNSEIREWFFISLLLIKSLQRCLGRSSLFDTARMLVFLEQPSAQSTVKNWSVTAQSHFSSWIKLKVKKKKHTSISSLTTKKLPIG